MAQKRREGGKAVSRKSGHHERHLAGKEVPGSTIEPRRLAVPSWPDDQLELLPDEDYLSSAKPGTTRADLVDPVRVFERLRAIDWSFANEKTIYLSHDLHPYPAKFIPQIPGTLISELSCPGELILDPFGGSGTTALEAVRLGRRAISIDANPLARLIGEVKTAHLDKDSTLDLKALHACVGARLRDGTWSAEGLMAEYQGFLPSIPNMDKWFPVTSRGELAWLRSQIDGLGSSTAQRIADLALSRIVLGASFQDSETRYASQPREIPSRATLAAFLASLDRVTGRVEKTSRAVGKGGARFITGDSRALSEMGLHPDSMDLVVTSPPYGNAMDYHLYHRFRLFWTGHDPKQLSRVEIGSHLRHQREQTGFDEFMDELRPVLTQLLVVLRPARYAVFVIGDSIYKGRIYSSGEALAKVARQVGWEHVGSITRTLPDYRRSFTAGRRATDEQLVIVRKPSRAVRICIAPPAYRPWPFEKELQEREAEVLLQTTIESKNGVLSAKVDPLRVNDALKLAFSAGITLDTGATELTWQRVLENGATRGSSGRKDPKYVTHGLHPYKGKFYPQLAKALLNLSGLSDGAILLDPFCGSGTGLLEGRLNGWQAHGVDMNPLAAKIARAKLGILDIDSRLVVEVFDAVKETVTSHPRSVPEQESEFPANAIDEIRSWFPAKVIYKMNWLLRSVRRASSGILQEFLEVIISSFMREVSHQDPRDLRIRRRKELLDDADVFGIFLDALQVQRRRLEEWWTVRSFCPHREYSARVVEGDSRTWSAFENVGVQEQYADLILTSPPYATALPYIDTDRLSLLVLFGYTSSERRPLEMNLTGSREILTSQRKALEERLMAGVAGLPDEIGVFIRRLYKAGEAGRVGFRRRNRPALLLRFFQDLSDVFLNCHRALKEAGECYVIIGDNVTRVNGEEWRIPTSSFTRLVAETNGFELREALPISVTTEDLKHIKHAIRENVVLRLRRR